MAVTNTPELWQHLLPLPGADTHKYSRGAALISGGGISMSGAARLAALSASRAGAGLVTVAAPKEALAIYAASLLSVIVKEAETVLDFAALLADSRANAVLIGPGHGVTERTRDFVLAALAGDKSLVLDADALTVFADNPSVLFSAIRARSAPVILTPHEGEFARLFTIEGEKLSRALEAAKESNAIVLLKGAETVIASPEGQVMVNRNAPPWLATAGSGDVLAGIITGLLAQKMEPFAAASMGAWLHGKAGELCGPYLVAEDLPAALPRAFHAAFPEIL